MRLLADNRVDSADEIDTAQTSPTPQATRPDPRPGDPTAPAQDPEPPLAARLATARQEYEQASQAWKDLNDQHTGAARPRQPSGLGSDKLTLRGAQRAAAQALREFVATSTGDQGSTTARREDATFDAAGRNRDLDLDPATATDRTVATAPATHATPRPAPVASSPPAAPDPPPGARPAVDPGARPSPGDTPVPPRTPDPTDDTHR
jgi:hypothetical protein